MDKKLIGILVVVALVAGTFFGGFALIALFAARVTTCTITAPFSLFTDGLDAIANAVASPLIQGRENDLATTYFDQFKVGSDRNDREAIAEQIITIGKQRGFDAYAISVAVATAIDESELKNADYGDRDSLGVYQQRPSAGWGTPQEILTPSYAINKFYDHLAGVAGINSPNPPAMIVAAEDVQIPNKDDYARAWAEGNIAAVATSIVEVMGKLKVSQSGSLGSGVLTSSISSCLNSTPSGTTSGGVVVNASGGSWTSPLAPGYEQTDPFGERISPVTHAPEFHTGIDLADPIGTPIYAVHDGTVITAAPDGTYGNWILINEGNNIESGYAHLSRYAVVTGQTVTEGQIIGYVGETGDATGPHLHFEIRENGTPVDPKPFMAQHGITIK